MSSLPLHVKKARRSWHSVAVAASIGLHGLGISAAYADDAADEANTPVKSRVHQHLQPQGIIFGDMIFYPQLSAGFLYDSNVFASPEDQEEDVVYVVSPKLIVEKDTEGQQHELTLAAKHMEFQRFADESRTEADGTLRSAWELASNLSLNSNLSAARKFEERGDSGTAVSSATLIGYYDLRASALLTRSFDSFGVTAGGGVRRLTFDDGETEEGGVIDQSFRDGTIFHASLRPFYEFSPGYRAYVNVDVNRRDYAGEGLLNRDSEGFDARGGVEFLLTPILFGSLDGGYLEQHYDNPDIPTASGMSGRAALTWLMTPLMTVALFASRSVSEIASPDQSVRLDFVAGAQLDYEITRNLIGSIAGKFRNETFTGSDREDEVWDVDARLDYTPNQYFSFGLSYLYTDRTSNLDGLSFDRHRVMFNVSARY